MVLPSGSWPARTEESTDVYGVCTRRATDTGTRPHESLSLCSDETLTRTQPLEPDTQLQEPSTEPRRGTQADKASEQEGGAEGAKVLDHDTGS